MFLFFPNREGNILIKSVAIVLLTVPKNGGTLALAMQSSSLFSDL